MSLLKEIRRQPEGVRKIMFVLSLVISLSLVGTVWFNSFERQLFSLLNPEEGTETETGLAAGQEESLFSSIGQMFRDLGAQISESIGSRGETEVEPEFVEESDRDEKARILPVVGDELPARGN